MNESIIKSLTGKNLQELRDLRADITQKESYYFLLKKELNKRIDLLESCMKIEIEEEKQDKINAALVKTIETKNLTHLLDLCKYKKFKSGYEVTLTAFLYFLFHKGKIVYIGTTVNICSRIYNHKKTGKEFDYYMYCETHESQNIEQSLISTFKTKYNKCNVSKKAHIDISEHNFSRYYE